MVLFNLTVFLTEKIFFIRTQIFAISFNLFHILSKSIQIDAFFDKIDFIF